MKILIVGDAIVASGFARCTHALADAAHAAGHDVSVLGINYFGDPHDKPYKVYPCRQPLDGGRDGFGVTRLPLLVDRLRPDVVVLLNDPWNVPAYVEALKEYGGDARPKLVGWLAVDGQNQAGSERLNALDAVIAWTEFGARELKHGSYSGEPFVIPLGVDTSVFYPRDKREARAFALQGIRGVTDETFIVGVVGRNQPRKRLDLAIQAFAECRALNDALLYMHVAPTGDSGTDLRSLARYHGVASRAVLAEPGIGHGIGEDCMPLVYSVFDVLMTTTQGEGWGLTTMEAMACGVPCVVPDFSGLGEWTQDAAVKIACTSTALTAPLNSLAYTIGGVPDREGLIAALTELHGDAGLRAEYGYRGRALTSEPRFAWPAIGREVLAVAEGILARDSAAAISDRSRFTGRSPEAAAVIAPTGFGDAWNDLPSAAGCLA